MKRFNLILLIISILAISCRVKGDGKGVYKVVSAQGDTTITLLADDKKVGDIITVEGVRYLVIKREK
jgi:hypothetical protein